VDPPDGRIPPQIPEAVKRNAAIAEARNHCAYSIRSVESVEKMHA